MVALTQQPPITVVEEFTGFVYTAGQGGTSVSSKTVQNVLEAAVVGVSGQVLGAVELKGDVVATGFGAGTQGITPVSSNKIVLSLYTAATGTIIEESTGTITEKVKVLIQGY